VVQYESYLQQHGVELEYLRQSDIDLAALGQIGNIDILYNQKCLLPLRLAKRVSRKASRIIFDFDDAVYTRPGRPYRFLTRHRVRSRLHYWLRKADAIFPANQYLADYACRCSEAVSVLPMALNLADWTPKTDASAAADTIALGWAGAPANLKYLEAIDGPLSRILQRYPQAKLRVFSGQRPSLTCPFDYVPFRDGAEPAFVKSLDIGLLPLERDEFCRGKSPIKAIQYLSCEVPVVGRIEGATREILNPRNSIAIESRKDWEKGLGQLIEDTTLRARMGQEGRRLVLRHHDVTVVRDQLLQALGKLAG